MSDVQFTEEETYDDDEDSESQTATSGFAGFLIKKGIVKDEKQANLVGIGAFVIIVIITLILL